MKALREYDGSTDEIILAEFDDPMGNKYFWLVNEATKEISFTTKSKGAIRGFKDFLDRHPYMTGLAVGVGINALDSYRSNKRLTTRFFATNAIERNLYKHVAKDLVATGKYTMLKNGKRIKNGWLWELKRKGV